MSNFSTSHTYIDTQGEQIKALHRLVNLCLRHQGGGTFPIIDFLMGMYNGHVWCPDMQLLNRRIDDNHFEDVLQVMRLYRSTGREPQTFFDNGEELFRELSYMSKRVTR